MFLYIHTYFKAHIYTYKLFYIFKKYIYLYNFTNNIMLNLAPPNALANALPNSKYPLAEYEKKISWPLMCDIWFDGLLFIIMYECVYTYIHMYMCISQSKCNKNAKENSN